MAGLFSYCNTDKNSVKWHTRWRIRPLVVLFWLFSSPCLFLGEWETLAKWLPSWNSHSCLVCLSVSLSVPPHDIYESFTTAVSTYTSTTSSYNIDALHSALGTDSLMCIGSIIACPWGEILALKSACTMRVTSLGARPVSIDFVSFFLLACRHGLSLFVRIYLHNTEDQSSHIQQNHTNQGLSDPAIKNSCAFIPPAPRR